MNKANECTCPSGDGSLVHPCPAHPSVEQAGGDERAAFELFVRKHCGMPEHIAVNWDAKFTNDAWEGWQARAALAQPSPAQAEQAEAERPGMSPERAAYFMRRFKSEEKLLGPNEQAAVDYVLSLLAQHERIVGALRAEVERSAHLAQVEMSKVIGLELRAEEAEQQRDAALARVAELESKLAELEKQEPIGWWAQYCETPMRRMVHWGAKGPECTSEEFHPFYAAPFVKAQHRMPGKYDEVLLPFLKSMEHELHANAGKGDRPGWLQMDRKIALLEIYYHLAKLQKATKDNDAAGIVEYAADVANMSMMLVDVCGLLAAAPAPGGE